VPQSEDLQDKDRLSTGIDGLDNILGGGLDPDSLYLVEGRPGTGKTTLGLQFLLEGVRRGEKGLYITLSESERELRVVEAPRLVARRRADLPTYVAGSADRS
jgi:circadian clock protein KaiC